MLPNLKLIDTKLDVTWLKLKWQIEEKKRIDKYALKLRSSINQDNTIHSNYEEDGHLKE